MKVSVERKTDAFDVSSSNGLAVVSTEVERAVWVRYADIQGGWRPTHATLHSAIYRLPSTWAIVADSYQHGVPAARAFCLQPVTLWKLARLGIQSDRREATRVLRDAVRDNVLL